MADVAAPTKPVASIADQAAFVERLAGYCERGGQPNEETILVLNRDEAEQMRALAKRLRLMAPWEPTIRKVVVG